MNKTDYLKRSAATVPSSTVVNEKPSAPVSSKAFDNNDDNISINAAAITCCLPIDHMLTMTRVFVDTICDERNVWYGSGMYCWLIYR
ncbi:hypothetical protein [secondary endosymbiont of Ctenarytaina eucalypti]|uniref:Uncharacterized protein n=1 Tax=secondary endosymbiont of Ctenarytaina eucalypti TaxID=1199245 RepID=J3YR79_9ENTR|nr:hypothetical protein [secondary endosymbiont of Ctenarytaina eucalypti]AFP84523.1 hypothetical protein A359_01200 [secondary endosymbiont of Ctenarytaina eucalypti]